MVRSRIGPYQGEPYMSLDMKSISVLEEALQILNGGFSDLPEFSPAPDIEALRVALNETAAKMRDNYPYHHPFYIGQMLKPPHPVARLAYMLSMWINPNNHALDGGRASSAMEKEAVAEIARMFGWETHLGHLCGGGTMANLEALWIAKSLAPGKKILASGQSHYTHERICGVLGIPFETVPCDDQGRMSVDSLEQVLKKGNVGTVVATVGTTATGATDPLIQILELREEHGFRVHADSAYGGYFTLVDNLRPETRAVYDHLSEADSIVVDPHKHGLQPYGCGCVIFRDPAVGRFYKHDSPYTYFSSSELHLGEISLECSRAGASATALWTTMKMLPLARDGEFAANLAKCREAALKLFNLIEESDSFETAFPPELDIVVWAPKAESVSSASKISEALFHEAADQGLHMAMAGLPSSFFAHVWPNPDRNTVTCLRACVMKPEHLEWMDNIWNKLQESLRNVSQCKE